MQVTPDLLLCESGGDNLAANFSSELADYTVYVIGRQPGGLATRPPAPPGGTAASPTRCFADVAGGDKVPRKGGPGITQSDLLVINKSVLPTSPPCPLPTPSRSTPNPTLDRSRPPPSVHTSGVPSVRRMHALQDLAAAVGADLDVMEADAARMRGDGPTILAAVKQGRGVSEIEGHLLAAWRAATGKKLGG